jgi:Protein of unknown function (DUF1292)
MIGFDDNDVNDALRTVDVIETTDEEGRVHYFEPVEEFEIDGQLYALLVYQGESLEPTPKTGEGEEDEEGYEEEFVVMKVVVDEEGRVYEAIENEEEFNKVMAQLESMDFEIDLHEHLGLCEDHVKGEECNHDHKHHDN